MARICDRCEDVVACCECTICRQDDGTTPLWLCQSCSSTIHIGKSQGHVVNLIELKGEASDQLLEALLAAQKKRAELNQRRRDIDDTIKKISDRCCKNKTDLANGFRQLLSDLYTTEERLLNGLETMRAEKVKYLNTLADSFDLCTSEASNVLKTTIIAIKNGTHEGLTEQLKVWCQSADKCLATPLCNAFGGYCPSLATVHKALQSLVTYYPWRLLPGETHDVTLVGGLQPSGKFSVLLCPSGSTKTNLDVLNSSISATVEQSHPELLVSPHPGQLCCAQYAVDNRWYRACIEKVSSESVKVMFLDYGNTEEVPLSRLHPLDENFLSYPCQVIDCYLTDDFKAYMLDKREVKWKFRDLVAGCKLSVHVIKELNMSNTIPCAFLVKLLDTTHEEHSDIGTVVLSYAQCQTDDKQPADNLINRDIRYKYQEPKIQFLNSMLSSSCVKGSSAGDMGLSKHDTSVESMTDNTASSIETNLTNEPHDAALSSHDSSHDASCESHGMAENTSMRPLDTQFRLHDVPSSISKLHSAVVVGAQLKIIVNSDISEDGIFWAQISTNDAAICVCVGDEAMCTPANILEGEYYLAQYSDNNWYRAVVEGKKDKMYLVRYVDFGNTEVLSGCKLAILKPKLKALPQQSIKCAIWEKTSLTKKKLEAFEKLVSTNTPVEAQVAYIDPDTHMVHLKVFLENDGRQNDVIWKIPKEGHERDVNPLKETKSEADIAEWIPDFATNSHERSWADEMEAADGTMHESGPLIMYTEGLKIQDISNRTTPPYISAEDASRGMLSKEMSRRRRLNKDLANKQILSNLKGNVFGVRAGNEGKGTDNRKPHNAPSILGAYYSDHRVTPDISKSQINTQGISLSLSDSGHNVASNKLLIKGFPVDQSRESLIDKFLQYGTVHELVFLPEDRNAAFITMDADGLQKVLDNFCKMDPSQSISVERCQAP